MLNNNINFYDKPSKLMRMHNGKHKKNALKQYMLLNDQLKYGDDRDKPNHYINKFNFKKTTAKKAKFSCGGYGGTCSMCRRDYQYGKNCNKRTIKYGQEGQKQLIFNIKSQILC